MMAEYQKAAELALECGFFKAGVVPVSGIVFDRSFRKACEQNTCGNYGKCWTCPPDAGDIDELIGKARLLTMQWSISRFRRWRIPLTSRE